MWRSNWLTLPIWQVRFTVKTHRQLPAAGLLKESTEVDRIVLEKSIYLITVYLLLPLFCTTIMHWVVLIWWVLFYPQQWQESLIRISDNYIDGLVCHFTNLVFSFVFFRFVLFGFCPISVPDSIPIGKH